MVVRPPPETSAYHEGNPLYGAVIDRLAGDEAVIAVVIPRTERQRSRARRPPANPRSSCPTTRSTRRSLIAFADVVVSAGGTMNREAVALGTPVYTIFSGRMGAVDEALIREGRLRESTGADALELRRRDAAPGVRNPRDPGLLVDAVLGAVG